MFRSALLFLALIVLLPAQVPPIPGLSDSRPNDSDQVNALPTNVSLKSRKRSLPSIVQRDASGRVDPGAIAVPAGDSIELPKATGIDIAGLIYEHSGKRVILSKAASETEIFFVQRGPMTNRELMKLLKASLLLEGLALIPDPQDSEVVRLLPSGPIAGITAQPLPYVDDPLDLPQDDQLITYLMRFSSLEPADAAQILQAAIGQFSPGGKISVVENAGAVLITENAKLIRQLLKIKEDIDKGAPITDAWVKVIYADVEEIAEQLNEIYGQSSQGRNNRNRTARRNPSGGSPAPPIPGLVNNNSGSGNVGPEVPISIIPDARTNRILIIGRAGDVAAVKKRILEYDIPSDTKTNFRYDLRYLRVNDFLPIAYSAIERTLSSQSQGGGGARSRTGGSTNNSGQGAANRNNRTTGQRSGGSTGGSEGASVNAQDVPTEPTAEVVGKTLLVADNVANAVIVQGPPHHIEIVRNLIKELDTAADQIVISAVVGSYGLTNETSFGVNLANILRANSSVPIGGITNANAGEGYSFTDFSNLDAILGARGAGGSGVSVYSVFGGDRFAAVINALEANDKFKVLERPNIMTRNNRVAKLTSGRRIAIPSSSFNGGSVGGQTTNIEYRDVVLELEIQPLINSDNEVTLEISLVRDTVSDTTRSVGDDLDVPDIINETLTSSVTVPNGDAVVIGGLITDRSSDGKSGVPILSRIPGIGSLFSTSNKGTERNELVVIIRPEIVKGGVELEQRQQNYGAFSRLSTEARGSLPAPVSTMLPANGMIAPVESEKGMGNQRKINLRQTDDAKRTFRAPTRKRRRGGRRR